MVHDRNADVIGDSARFGDARVHDSRDAMPGKQGSACELPVLTGKRQTVINLFQALRPDEEIEGMDCESPQIIDDVVKIGDVLALFVDDGDADFVLRGAGVGYLCVHNDFHPMPFRQFSALERPNRL